MFHKVCANSSLVFPFRAQLSSLARLFAQSFVMLNSLVYIYFPCRVFFVFVYFLYLCICVCVSGTPLCAILCNVNLAPKAVTRAHTGCMIRELHCWVWIASLCIFVFVCLCVCVSRFQVKLTQLLF